MPTVPRPLTAVRLLRLYALAAVAWAVAAALCLCVGSTGGVEWPAGLILDIRLERVLLASLVGAGLAGGGVAYQAVLRNPLADPYLLGASGGATLLAFVWTIPTLAMPAALLALGQQGFAFAGALAAVAVVLLCAGGTGRLEPTRAVLVGVIVSAVCASVLMLLVYLNTTPGGPGGAVALLFGAIQTSLTTTQKAVAAATAGVGSLLLALLAGGLNAAALGEDEAESLGLRVNRLRWLALVVASLIVAAAVAVGGPIGFVGLIGPHVGRLIVGPDNRRLLPVALALGAVLLAAADTATRYLSRDNAFGTVLPVGVVTGLLGGPFFLVLLYGRRGRIHA